MSADRDEFYRDQARAVLGDEMFAACRREALNAPPPTAEQLAVVARIFGPALRRLTARETPKRLAKAA